MVRITCFVLVLVQIYGIHGDQSVVGGALAQIIDYIFHNLGDGNFHWGFSSTDGIQRSEEGVLENPDTEQENYIVRGSYSYPDPHGKTIKVKYTADKYGFHPEGDDIFVPPYEANDEQDNKIDESAQTRFHRQFIDNDIDNNHVHSFDYQQAVSQLLNQQNQDAVYRQQQFPVQNQNNNFNYDKSLLEFFGGNSHGNANYEQQVQNQKPIIAIVGDDGRIIDSSLHSDNIPDSILELLGKSATNSFPKLSQQQVHDVMVKNGIPEMIEKALTEALRINGNIETDNVSQSSVVENKGLPPSTTPSSNQSTSSASANNSTKV